MRIPWSSIVPQSARFWARNRETAFILAFCLGSLLARPATAAWRMTVQSRTVTVGETGVTVTLTYSWDIALNAVVLPIVARSTRNWAFWTGNLPYDTTDLEGNRFTQGVTWDPNVASWSGIIREMRPNPSSYDGLPPVDNFVITNQGVGNLAAKQNGAPWVTIRFDVNNWPGEFEFDTAFFNASLGKIFMLDRYTVDHGPPPGTNDVQFRKGVIQTTIGEWGHWPECGCASPSATQDVITSPYGPRYYFGYDYHSGIDIDLILNDPVHAILSGTVTTKREQPGYGWRLWVESVSLENPTTPQPLSSFYHHLNEPSLSENDQVNRSDVVGTCGEWGSMGDHVHIETQRNSDDLPHPVRYLNKEFVQSCPVFDLGWMIYGTDSLVSTCLSPKDQKYDLTGIHVFIYPPGYSSAKKAVIDFEDYTYMKDHGATFSFYAGTDYAVNITLRPHTLNTQENNLKIDIKVDPVQPILDIDHIGVSLQDVSTLGCDTVKECDPGPLNYCTAIGNITGYSPGVLLQFFDGGWVDDHVELIWRGASGIQSSGVRVYRSIDGAPEELAHSGLLRFSGPPGDTVIHLDYAVAKDDDLAYRLAVQFPYGGSVFAEQTVHLDREPSEPAPVPRAFGLEQNYPNPFNAGTNISFALDSTNSQGVTLSVFNILGQQVATLLSEAMARPGRYSLHWDGRDDNGHRVASGVYFCRLRSTTNQATKRMVLLR